MAVGSSVEMRYAAVSNQAIKMAGDDVNVELKVTLAVTYVLPVASSVAVVV